MGPESTPSYMGTESTLNYLGPESPPSKLSGTRRRIWQLTNWAKLHILSSQVLFFLENEIKVYLLMKPIMKSPEEEIALPGLSNFNACDSHDAKGCMDTQSVIWKSRHLCLQKNFTI